MGGAVRIGERGKGGVFAFTEEDPYFDTGGCGERSNDGCRRCHRIWARWMRRVVWYTVGIEISFRHI